MKTVYFVRHGQSEGNVGSLFQHADSPLNEHGKKQAQFVAERCARLSLDVIVSSPQPRAALTAQIIAEKTGHDVIFSDLFVERVKPSSMEGKLHSDPEAQRTNAAWWQSLAGAGPRVEDGEHFDDLKERARSALEYLVDRPEENILVVTHGFFLRYLIAFVLFGAELSSVQFEPMMRRMWTENTGITVIRYKQERHGDEVGLDIPWVLWTWNDHAHLG